MNKIKGSSSAVKMKYLLFVFAAAVLVSLPTRVYQLLALVDTTNGFFKENDVTIPVLYGVVVVFGLLFLVLSFVSKEVPSPKLPAGKNPILGIASFIMVAGLGWDMFKILMDVIPFNQGSASIFVSILRSNLEQSGGMFTILHFVFAFFAIIYFLVFAISHLNGKASYKEFKILALSPLCWAMTVLVTNLMNAISFIKVSEILFEIFMFVFAMLFFLTFARISSGVFTEDSMWGIYGYGLTASLLAAIVTIPRLVMMFVGLDAVEGNEFNFVHLSTMVFIVAYIFASLGVGFKEGLRARREVSEVELPEDGIAITKKDDFNTSFEDDDYEETEEVTESVEIYEEPEFVEPVIEIAESEDENVEKLVVEEPVIEEAVIEEPVIEEPVIEEPAINEFIIDDKEEKVETLEPENEVSESAQDYNTIEYAEQATSETKQKKSKALFKMPSKSKAKVSEEISENDELKPISLADLKKRNSGE